jgi:hypothetical protein
MTTAQTDLQNRLLKIRGNSILEIAIHNAAKNDLGDALRLIRSCYEDNPEMMRELLGATLMAEILKQN